MRRLWHHEALMLWAILLSSALTTAAEEPRRVGFEELVALALQNDPERAVAGAERRAAAAAVDLARWMRWSPRLSATSAFGVVPGARGNVYSSPDTPRDLDDFGPFWRVRLDMSMPILSFGRLESAQQAAAAALASKDAKLGARRGDVAALAARAYYGYVLARQNLAAARRGPRSPGPPSPVAGAGRGRDGSGSTSTACEATASSSIAWRPMRAGDRRRRGWVCCCWRAPR